MAIQQQPPQSAEPKQEEKKPYADRLQDLLTKHASSIAAALPFGAGQSAEQRLDHARRLIKIAMQAYSRTPALKDCTPASFYLALLTCAELDLEPGVGPLAECHIVPYENKKAKPPRVEAQFQPGYRGLVKLARNAGELAGVHVGVVRKTDAFSYWTDEHGRHLKHVPSLEDNPGPLTHAFAIFVMRDGTTQIEVMTKAQIEKRRQASQSGKNMTPGTPWVMWYEEQAEKTVLKRGIRLVPLSAERRALVEKAIVADNRADGIEDKGGWQPPTQVVTVSAADLAAGAIPLALLEPQQRLEDDDLEAALERHRAEEAAFAQEDVFGEPDAEQAQQQTEVAPPEREPGEDAELMDADEEYRALSVEQRIARWRQVLAKADSMALLSSFTAELERLEPSKNLPVRLALTVPYLDAMKKLGGKGGKR